MEELNGVKIFDYYVPDKNAPQGSVEVEWAQIEFETDVNLTDKKELIRLMYAALHGHSETIREMVENGEL